MKKIKIIGHLVVPSSKEYKNTMVGIGSPNVTVVVLTQKEEIRMLNIVLMDMNEELDLFFGTFEEELLCYDQLDAAMKICERWRKKCNSRIDYEGLMKIMKMINLAKEKESSVTFYL